MDSCKQRIARSAAEWFVHKMPPWVNEKRREMWIEMITDCVLSALAVFEEELAQESRAIRTFCMGCAQSVRAKEKQAGGMVQCPFCGRKQKLQFGRN